MVFLGAAVLDAAAGFFRELSIMNVDVLSEWRVVVKWGAFLEVDSSRLSMNAREMGRVLLIRFP
jgi:hypothetical protein